MIKNIQYLRFLAAFIVVFAHSNMNMYGLTAKATDLGGFGVDIFFVISGFIMPFILFGGKYKNTLPKITAGQFIWRRITRIWPMYFLATMCVVVLSWMVANSMFEDARVDFAYHYNATRTSVRWIIDSLTFTHGLNPPVLGTGWTLQVEFMFYTAFAAVLLSKPKTLTQLEISLIGLFVFFFVAGNSHLAIAGFAKTYANPMIIEFAFGMLVYRMYSFDRLIPKSAALILLIAALPLFLWIELSETIENFGPLYRPLVWGGFAFVMVASAMSLEKYSPNSKFLLLLGDASYSLYLVHYIIGPVMIHYWTNNSMQDSVSIWLYMPMFIIICHIAGIATHLYIEKPINAAIRKASTPKPVLAIP